MVYWIDKYIFYGKLYLIIPKPKYKKMDLFSNNCGNVKRKKGNRSFGGDSTSECIVDPVGCNIVIDNDDSKNEIKNSVVKERRVSTIRISIFSLDNDDDE